MPTHGAVIIFCFFNLYLERQFGEAAATRHPHESVEKNLIQMLLNKYERFGVIGRPVNSSEIQIVVRYGLALVQILDLDENRQILRTICWSRYRWTDHLLQWKPFEYGNIRQIRVFPNQVWTPDIKLYNFANERMKEHRHARVVVFHTGHVMWVPQALFKSTCPVEITYFPFDKQICELEFGSWSYDVSQLDIDWWAGDGAMAEPSPYVDFNDYVESNEWYTDGQYERNLSASERRRQIRSVKRIRNVTFTLPDGKNVTRQYPTLRYLVRLKRNPSFYVSILVIPCILLSSLTLVLFWLPPESPAKLMLGMNIFVAFFILLLLLADSTPSAVKNFPIIGCYYCLNMILITLSTFLAAVVINLYFRGDKKGPVPSNIRRIIVEGIGRLLLVRQNIPLEAEDRLARLVRHSSSSVSPCRVGRHRLIKNMRHNKFLDDEEAEVGETCASADIDSPLLGRLSRNEMEKNVHEIKLFIRQYTLRVKDKEENNLIAMEWRTLALILDRLFFCLYVTSIFVAIIILIPK